ncbi:MAG: cytidine deaminase [Myxococcaceae bacterium]|nr:cytidine deaminase [Myxococcaceae bacterium]
MPERSWSKLWNAAEKARRKAHAPYSKFHVGAAIECDDGSIVSGCNVENASYGLTVCAERNAIGAMVLKGRTPLRVAIVVDHSRPVPPCGVCRQVLAEFAEEGVPVRSRTLKGDVLETTVGELLPFAFSGDFLDEADAARRARAKRR